MPSLNYIFLKIISFAILNFLFLKIALPFLREHFMRNPNERDSHNIPTPRSGGIIFIISAYIMILIDNFNTIGMVNIVLASTPVAIIGLIDDKLDLSRVVRYFFQVLTSILIIYYSRVTINFNLENNFIIKLIVLVLLLISFTAIINFINFMDGLDGLVAGVMIIVFSYIAIENYPNLWFLVGSLLGFLILNWHPSKVFMGDIGSTFLGAVFVGLLSFSNSMENSFTYLLISSPLLLDAFICVIRRFIYKQNIFSPHKEHLYQRLNKADWSHEKVSSIYILMSLFIAISVYFWGTPIALLAVLLEIMIGLILDKYYAVEFLN